jgi:hypothetical protein
MAAWDDEAMALSLVRGDGVAFRLGTVMGVVLRTEGTAPDDVGAILQICRSAAPTDLAHGIGRLLLDRPPGGFPSFAVVATVDDELMVLLHGDMELIARQNDQETAYSGREASTWTERRVPLPVDELRVFPTGGDSQADLWTDLREGVAHAGGFRLRRLRPAAESAPRGDEADATRLSAEPLAPGAGLAVGEQPSEFEAVSLVGPQAATTAERREPLPVVGHGEAAGPREDQPVIVQGIRCARDHHNNPQALYCSRCGIKMVHRTHVLVDGARPPLGVVTFDDGATFAVNKNLIIGREPTVDERVIAEAARPVQIRDEQRAVSRAHLAILLDEWMVYAVDLESANGTFVRAPGEDAWRRLAAGEQFELRTGASVRIGGREFVFDQHHVA